MPYKNVLVVLFLIASVAISAPVTHTFNLKPFHIIDICPGATTYPFMGCVQHGPTVPPDPWDGLSAASFTRMADHCSPGVCEIDLCGWCPDSVAEQNEHPSTYRAGVAFHWAYPQSSKPRQR